MQIPAILPWGSSFQEGLSLWVQGRVLGLGFMVLLHMVNCIFQFSH